MTTNVKDKLALLHESSIDDQEFDRLLGKILDARLGQQRHLDLDEEELMKECTMDNIVLEIPKESALGLRVSVGEAGNIVLMAAAVKLFEMGQLSSGAAARLAGVPRVIFLSSLADYGVDTFRLTEMQLARETRLA